MMVYVLPTRGDRMLTRCFESWYVGEFTKDNGRSEGYSGFMDLRKAIEE